MTDVVSDPFAPLHSQLQEMGFTISRIESATPALLGSVTGNILENKVGHFKANSKICQFSIIVDVLTDAEVQRGASLFVDLLELNFAHTFGRVSLVSIPGSVLGRPEPKSHVLVCETMYFWIEAIKKPEWFKTMTEERVRELVHLHSGVVELLGKFRKFAEE